jgi:Family of unknown function (DUF6011)
VKCGNCHQDHETVQQVKDCYGVPAGGPRHNRNKYPGDCVLCGAKVESQAGHVELVNNKWKVFHNTGDCVAKFAEVPAMGDPSERVQLPAPADWNEGVPAQAKGFPDISAGHYAVKSLTGNNDLDFFRVDRPESGRWDGYTFVKRIIGGHPESRVRGKWANLALLAIQQADPVKAAWLYGQELGRCSNCNRHLTQYASRRLSLGPDCADDAGLGDVWRKLQSEAPEGEQ